MLNDRSMIEGVAAAIHQTTYRKQKWEDAPFEGKKDARMAARTVISAYELGQSRLDAAKKLATWHWVDQKKPHVPWEKAPEALQNTVTRQADAGFDAITAILSGIEEPPKVYAPAYIPTGEGYGAA